MLARFTPLPTDDEMKLVADVTAKETTSHSDALDLCLEGSRPSLERFTQIPPSLRSRDRISHNLLVARWWISNRGDWLGPAKGRKRTRERQTEAEREHRQHRVRATRRGSRSFRPHYVLVTAPCTVCLLPVDGFRTAEIGLALRKAAKDKGKANRDRTSAPAAPSTSNSSNAPTPT